MSSRQTGGVAPQPMHDPRYRLRPLKPVFGKSLAELPFSLRILAENLLAQEHWEATVQALKARQAGTIEFVPSRLILQDMLGLPLLLDLMMLREEAAIWCGTPEKLDIYLPVDLVIDHSMTVVSWANSKALAANQNREFELNRERFEFFRACEKWFPNLTVIPPGGGIMHQVNLEYLASVAQREDCGDGTALLKADTVLGTDSHTPMINGLGVMGWGIGGLDAESIMLGNALAMNVPEVVGLEIIGRLSENVTATDLALTIAEILRDTGVVGSFVELFGPGYGSLDVPTRATVSNMSPEYGATCVYCPIDQHAISYLRQTGRSEQVVKEVEFWSNAQGLWSDDRSANKICYDRVVTLDLSKIRRSVSGPSRPEQRMDLANAPLNLSQNGDTFRYQVEGREFDLGNHDVIVAAITSCTNTANPRNMIAAGLVARNAVNRGLATKPWIKTSLAPGSRAVAAYLQSSGLQKPLDQLSFHVAGFACTTCNGMSGPLDSEISDCIERHNLQCAAVLSGNRNFAGRIHPHAKANVLASPPLVVAYAIAGTLQIDLAHDPIGEDQEGSRVFLSDLWPQPEEVNEVLLAHATPDVYRDTYAVISKVSPQWSSLNPRKASYEWNEQSTYITRPPFLENFQPNKESLQSMRGLRPLVILADHVTTDHISPSGYITRDSAAGRFLLANGVTEEEFNSYGTRRGCNDIVVRSTFASMGLENELTPNHKGSWTKVFPDGRMVSVFEAVEHYQKTETGLIVIAGRNYGGGSSRDTAAKAPWLAGVRAVIAESFERIHRSNLINMGIIPLQFEDGMTRHDLALSGSETFDIHFECKLREAKLEVISLTGERRNVNLLMRLYNSSERATLQAGGLLARTLHHQLKTVGSS